MRLCQKGDLLGRSRLDKLVKNAMDAGILVVAAGQLAIGKGSRAPLAEGNVAFALGRFALPAVLHIPRTLGDGQTALHDQGAVALPCKLQRRKQTRRPKTHHDDASLGLRLAVYGRRGQRILPKLGAKRGSAEQMPRRSLVHRQDEMIQKADPRLSSCVYGAMYDQYGLNSDGIQSQLLRRCIAQIAAVGILSDVWNKDLWHRRQGRIAFPAKRRAYERRG